MEEKRSRRRLLKGAGVAVSVPMLTTVAGCTSSAGDESEADGTGDDERDGEADGADESKSKETDDEPDEGGADPERPVIFVHGGLGSATQFESQSMRFASNGYPPEYLAAYEYDSVAYEEIQDEIVAGLHERIQRLLEETDADQVDAMGHSRGTSVMQNYLADSDRAELIGNYVNIDGREADSQPGGVPTLAVWGLGNEEASIEGAENVHFEQSHVEVATSAEAFGAIYEFLHGEEPATTAIEPEPADEVTLAGRAAVFPQNAALEEACINVYEVDPETGERLESVATTGVDDHGRWGPIDVDGSAHHEFAVHYDDGAVQHVYRQPEIRSNHFVRLLVGEPGGMVDQLVDRGPDHAIVVVNRDKEFWGDQCGANDELLIDGTDIVTPTTAPREKRIIAPMVFDAGADGESDVSEPVASFQAVPFLTGIDVHIPAADPPTDAVPVVSRPRDGDGVERSVAVQNWPSDDHRITVQFPDHVQTR